MSKNDLPQQEQNCPKCNNPLSIFVDKCAQCGKIFSADEIRERIKSQGDNKPLFGCIAIIISIFIIAYWLFVPSKEEKARQAALEAIERKQAKHCLSPLDGSNYYIDKYVSARMRNPDSYEHIKTNVAEIGADGNHEFIVTYRAQNGFGGMNIGSAIGKFDNESCQVVKAEIVGK